MDRRIESVLAKVVDNPGCARSIENLASPLNLSASRLRHLFRQEVDLPLGVFARKARMERARALLVGSFLSVKQVAFETGFADETHFCREFRKVYGTTPGLYRHRLQISSTNLKGQQKKPTNSQNRRWS